MPDVISRRFAPSLPPAALMRLKELTSHHRALRPHQDLIRQGEMPADHYFVLEGYLCRHKLLSGGRRAVLSYLLPGDFCGPHPDFESPLDHGIAALTTGTVAEVSHAALLECLRADADLTKGLSQAFLQEVVIQRQWLTNMGCAADTRLAHLLCELRVRLAQVGLADERGFLLPLTQHELSEAVGISTVHVNRVLQQLKDLSLVRILDRRVMISDLAALESFAAFDPSYLDMMAPALQRLPVAV